MLPGPGPGPALLVLVTPMGEVVGFVPDAARGVLELLEVGPTGSEENWRVGVLSISRTTGMWEILRVKAQIVG